MYHTYRQLFAEAGSTTITSASGTIKGEFVAIQCITAVTFTTLVNAVEFPPSSVGGTGNSLAASQTYPAGYTLRGRFTDIAIATGSACVIKASRQA